MQTSTVTSVAAANIPHIINKGTGAGGARTNLFGKAFEEKTNNEGRLLDMGFERGFLTASAYKRKKPFDYLFKKMDDDKTIIYCTQHGLKAYMKQEYNVLLKRNPDEAYLIKYNTGKNVLKILEKKEQNVSGSVSDKLYGGLGIRVADYEMPLGNQFHIIYAYCVNAFLKKEYNKNEGLIKFNMMHNINMLYGDDADYFETLDKWIYSQ